MARVLLVDTNFSSGPIYHYLTRARHEVYVVGGNSRDFLARYSNRHFNVDYSNLEKVREIIQREKIDYIVPGCNDQSYKVCAELNSTKLYSGIDSLDSTETLNNKDKFKSFALKHGLPVATVLTREEVDGHWPIIIKPVDAYSGRGISILRDEDKHKLDSAINHAIEFSRSGDYLIEEYVEGQLYSHTAFIEEGRVIKDFIVEEHCTANPFTVDTSRVINSFPEEIQNQLQNNVNTMAQILNLTDGLVHTQFIHQEGKYWLIEVTRRCPGDLYSQLIEFSTGFNYAENYTRPFLGLPYKLNKTESTNQRIMRHTLSWTDDILFGSIQFLTPIKIEKYISVSQTGDCIKSSPFSRIGIVFTQSDTDQDFDHLFERTLNRNLYNIES